MAVCLEPGQAVRQAVPGSFSPPDDIEVRFYEDDENGWQAFGDFSPTDVHKQVREDGGAPVVPLGCGCPTR